MRSSTQSRTRRWSSTVALATALTLMVVAPALAHRLPGREARQAVLAHAARQVPQGTFVKAVVKCARFSEHHFLCGVGYETAGTQGNPQVACREIIVAFVKSHTDKLRLKTNALCRPTPAPSKAQPVPPNTPVGIPTGTPQCVPPLQFGDTTNVGPANPPPSPDNPVACETTVQQSSAASG